MVKSKAGLGRLWLPIQSLALLSAIISPILFKLDSEGNMDRSLALRNLKPVSQVISRIRRVDGSMTSSIFMLPEPKASSVNNKALHLELASRQLRFEFNPAALNRGRSPASATAKVVSPLSPAAWNLSRIQRKDEGGWEDVQLISEGSHSIRTASSFVELDEGSNEFLVTFRNPLGEQRSYSVKINHSPVKKYKPY